MIPIATGIILAWLWWLLLAKTCRYDALVKSLDSSTGHLLEIGLYKDSPKAILASLWELCRSSVQIGRRLILPCLLFSLLCLPIIGAISDTQRLRPLRTNESILVSTAWENKSPLIQLPSGLTLETEPDGIIKNGETFWRLRADQTGDYQIVFQQGQQKESKALTVDETPRFLSSKRCKSWLDWFLHPTEACLPKKSLLSSIRVDYEQRETWLGNIRIHWLFTVLVPFLLALVPTRRMFNFKPREA